MREKDKIVRPSRRKTLKSFLGKYGWDLVWLEGEEYSIWTHSGLLSNQKMLACMIGTEVTVHRLDYYDKLADAFRKWEKYWGEKIVLIKLINRRPAEGPLPIDEYGNRPRAEDWVRALRLHCEYCGRLFKGSDNSCAGCGAPR